MGTRARTLMKEIGALTTKPPHGIRLRSEEESDFDRLVAIIAGPGGSPYEKGFFSIRFAFPPDYPISPPKCDFITKIFHPNVGPSGEVCVSTLKKDWEKSMGVLHILQVIRSLLIHPNPTSALNAEAGRLLLEHFDDFEERARLFTSVHAAPRSPPREFVDIVDKDEDAAPSSSTASSLPFPKLADPLVDSTTTSATIPSSNAMPLSPKKRTVSNISATTPVELDPKTVLAGETSAAGKQNVAVVNAVGKSAGPAKKRGLKRL